MTLSAVKLMGAELQEFADKHPASREARTRFKKTVRSDFSKPLSGGLRVLGNATNIPKLTAQTLELAPGGGGLLGNKPAHTSQFIKRGPFAGLPMRVLTLEERATCPTSCKAWEFCYGDHMFLAKRNDAFADGFEDYLRGDLREMARMYPNGYVIRLHELGDFYSVEYVELWREMSAELPALHVYGYTHRGDEIADAIDTWQAEFPGRVAIMNSDNASPRTTRPAATIDGAGVPCPQQTGKTASCSTCGLCMNGTTKVSFSSH
jgi:hypothetical protein